MNREQFVFVEYNNIPYPAGFISNVKEVAAHFDKSEIEAAGKYSMHTEYSYGKRKLVNALISKFPALKNSNKDSVPQLWYSVEWAAEFADFIIELTRDNNAPEVIEIHPPFNDYCDLSSFAERYNIFEKKIHSTFPDVCIVIENRSGAIYKGGRFLIGKAAEIVSLCELIESKQLNLGIVLDFPQLLTAENIDSLKFNQKKYQAAIDSIVPYKHLIKGIHIWGKKKSESGRWVAHAGNLDTYFGNDAETKALFIAGIESICNDNSKRYFVPEVNTGANDLSAIMRDIFLS